MEKIIRRVKCPNCGIILKLSCSPSADLSKGKLTCSNCKETRPFPEYREIVDKPVQDETQILAPLHDTIGHLVDDATRQEYPLKLGGQMIGRKARTPRADVLIDTDDMGFSRSQFYVRVMKGKDGRYHTYITEASQSNPTSVNGVVLDKDEEIGLKHNDRISSSRTTLRFVGTTIEDITIPGSLIPKQ